MQITEKLNSEQSFCSEEVVSHFTNNFPIIKEMAEAGYEIDFYEVIGFGGLTVVPTKNRIRVKLNPHRLQHEAYVEWLVSRLRWAFERRQESAEFQVGKKVSTKFAPPNKGIRKGMGGKRG